MEFREMFVVFAAVICRAGGTTTEALTDGCVLTRSQIKDPYRDSLEMPHPFLNCSSLGKSSFNQSGLPEDLASISLAHNNLKTFDPTMISNFKSLKKLDLRSNKISALSSANVTFGSVSDLYLGFNKLTKLPTGFCSSFPSLYTLDLSTNLISAIGDNDFTCFRNLGILSLTLNPLEDISDMAFKDISNSLIALSLSSTGLHEVPAFVSSMPRLIMLFLSRNQISNIRANAFNGSTYIQWLELSGNKISEIDRRAFAGMEKLRLLDLTDNRIESLESGVFDSLKEDEQLSIELYENPLRCDCSLLWLKLWADSLSFKDVRYKCMQPNRNHAKKSYELTGSDFQCDPNEEDWADDCKKSGSTENRPTASSQPESTSCPESCKCYDSYGAQYYPTRSPASGYNTSKRRPWYFRDEAFPRVDCFNATLTTLPPSIRGDIKSLSMEKNLLGRISIDDLNQFPSLAMLDLEGCGLRQVTPSTTGSVLQSLTTLLLQHNELTFLGRNILSSFPKLRTLMIYHNKIATFPSDMFSSNKFLRRLYLGSNPVKKFDPRCLEGLQLYSLSLRNMNLTQIPVLQSKNMTSLELSDNNITVIPNNTFVGTSALFRLTIDNNLISVIEPAAFNGTSKLRYLDLSENKLTKLPRGVFDDLTVDRVHIEMWRNRMYCDCNLRWFKTWIEELEAVDPMTEVRFLCFRPWRLHGKPSDKLHPSDFNCQESDENATPKEGREEVEEDFVVYEHGKCYSSASIAAAVTVTFISTLLVVLLVKWCLARRRKRYARYSAHDDAQLDVDM